ncbi:MAG: histidine phosphatase family protein [Parvularculaceae bacterium]
MKARRVALHNPLEAARIERRAKGGATPTSMGPGRIITVRHGRPDLSRDMVITSREYGDWWAAYDRSGLAPGEEPPTGLLSLARNAPTVMSSPLPRAVETAAKVADARSVPADALYVEAPLPPPPVPLLKLRPGQWGVVSRAFWVMGYAPGDVESHAETWARVGRAAARLAAVAADGDVVLCAHGYFNWMVDRDLRRRGWRRVAQTGGNHFWSWRVYDGAGAGA